MSDFLDNGPEVRYQWSPYDNEPKKPEKPKKEKSGFGKKLARATAIALVFGLVSGVTFKAASLGTEAVYDRVTEKETREIELPQAGEIETTVVEPEVKKEDVASQVATVSATLGVSDITSNVMPAVVQVTITGVQELRTLFGTYTKDVKSAGSGIIISQDDEYIYIASNNHVVEGSESLAITFEDGASVEGEIKGTDNSCDLAVISVKVSDIPESTLKEIKVASMGSSDETMVGENCVVIGNALGYGQSVTYGVVSAKNIQVDFMDDNGQTITNILLQTDAAVNPGNSGGALLNMKGQVIGIVSAKLSDTDIEGVGYAIPIDTAAGIIQQMINSDVVNELNASLFGISGVDVTKAIAEQYNLPQGVYVQSVTAGSGAEAAGIESEDVITSFNGRVVTSMSTIQNALKYLPAGTTVDVTVAKAKDNYVETTVQVTLTHRNAMTQ